MKLIRSGSFALGKEQISVLMLGFDYASGVDVLLTSGVNQTH